MDPDLVRLILFFLGVLLVVGIYLWDRYKRSAPGVRRAWRSADTRPDGGERIAQRAEPVLPPTAEPVSELSTEQEDATESAGRQEIESDPAEDAPTPGGWSAPRRDEDTQFAMDLRFDAHGDGKFLGPDSGLSGKIAPKIVVINLAAREGTIAGPAIERACAAGGLSPGEMSIYHQVDPANGRVLFSMASMVEPGAFPFDGMAGFATPGLTLFTQLPGAGDDIEVYDAMLATGQRLADALRAELRDERHNKLTRQMQEHTREAIIEHRRKIRLARSQR